MRHVQPTDDPTFGDVWTYCAIDSNTKLVPTFRVTGTRDIYNTTIFISDLASRLKNRVQISSDAMVAYQESIETVFGMDVDYGQIVKAYVAEDSTYSPERKYSQPRIKSSEKFWVAGNPNWRDISTSYVERMNATTRLHVKRLNRLTLAFSKKFENFEAAVALHFAAHNFVRTHRTVKMTPAMAAGVERNFWSYGDLVEAAF